MAAELKRLIIGRALMTDGVGHERTIHDMEEVAWHSATTLDP